MGLSLRKKRGSKNWHMRGTVGGVFVEESTGASDKRAARAIADARELAIAKDRFFGRGANVTFLEAAVSYLATVGGEQKRCVGLLLDHFKATPLADIDQTRAEGAALALYPDGSAENIRRSCIGPLQALLNHAELQGSLGVDAFKGYRAPNLNKGKWPTRLGRPHWLTPEQWEQFRAEAEKRYPETLVPFAAFTLYTGPRLSDVLGLEWDRDVRMTERLAIFRDDKNGDDRYCYLPDEAFMALANLKRQEGKPRVFWFYRSNKDVYAEWNEVRDAIGLPWLTPHILCHTFATWLTEFAGASPRDLLETKRWKSLASVMRYAHTPEHRVRRLIDAMPGQHSGSPKKKEGTSDG